MPKLDVSPRSTAKQGEDDLKLAALTRDDVAERLGVSITARVGVGEYRVSAYGFEPRSLGREVFVRLGDEAS